MTSIRTFCEEYDEYLRDESRSVGHASSISFPTDVCEICETLRTFNETGTPVTVQGGRTGLAAGAVPQGGHILNLSKMNRALSMRKGPSSQGAFDTYYLTVEPGAVLSQVRKDLEDKNVDTTGWNEASLEAWRSYCDDGEFFFPTDPTETSATLGGMVACNASGARSFRYKAVRPYVSAITVVLANGDVVELQRGACRATGRNIVLSTASGRTLDVALPTYEMPDTKNASGYYAADDMDAVDLFVGSDGTLGVIVAVELELLPQHPVIWGVSCFFATEADACSFTVKARREMCEATAIEYFDADALDVLRVQKSSSTAFANLPEIPADAGVCVFVELACDDEQRALDALWRLGSLVEQSGGSEDATWVARTALDREAQRFFRHAVPESVNMLIDERRKENPRITKLGSDMSVPNDRLFDVVELYRTTLAQEGLQTAAWGHIGNNHLHVNVLPRNDDEYARGKRLFASWAQEVTRMGGAVSAEHGVGKLKRDFLLTMYGQNGVEQMARTKLCLDPKGILGAGNLFSTELFDTVRKTCTAASGEGRS